MQQQHRDPHPTDPVMAAEACPGYGATDQVRSTGSTLNTATWVCDGCGLGWAVSLINSQLRDRAGDYAEQAGALRWYSHQIITLAQESPQLTDRELRRRLLALAESCGAR